MARAVRFARGGEAWRPRDVRREAEEVFGFAAGVAWPVRSAERTLRVENAAPGRFGQAVDIVSVRYSEAVVLEQLVGRGPGEAVQRPGSAT